MIFRHLEITLATYNGQIEMRIILEGEDRRYTKCEFVPEDYLVSMFDCVFDRAKAELRRSLEKKEAP